MNWHQLVSEPDVPQSFSPLPASEWVSDEESQALFRAIVETGREHPDDPIDRRFAHYERMLGHMERVRPALHRLGQLDDWSGGLQVRNPGAKVTASEVRKIREEWERCVREEREQEEVHENPDELRNIWRLEGGRPRERYLERVSVEYGMHLNSLRRIVHRQSWKWVD